MSSIKLNERFRATSPAIASPSQSGTKRRPVRFEMSFVVLTRLIGCQQGIISIGHLPFLRKSQLIHYVMPFASRGICLLNREFRGLEMRTK